eukprot:TRINITY_DN1911_c0_g1_i1.p1 TRINITY_DN1911_c0_g1~~TRINITY_DN1911_c0_g1_i1.p1  ORF type:complete len:400 (-),score=75.98 TRINITY_DN1911_c0_g1_i1:8-1048(-)
MQGGYMDGGHKGGYMDGGMKGGYMDGGHKGGYMDGGMKGGYMDGGHKGGYMDGGMKGGWGGGWYGGYMKGGYMGGFFWGTVKQFHADKQWGLIDCPQTWHMYGKDMFFGRQAIPEGAISVGDYVQFTLKMEDKGPAVQYMMRVGMEGGMGYNTGTAGTAGPGGLIGSGWKNELFYGVLKSWSEEKGYGHIVCSESYRICGKDIFLPRSELQGQTVSENDLMSFRISETPKGPQAATVSVMPPGSFKTDDAPSATFTGVLKAYSVDKFYGFLQGEHLTHIYGKDIFFHGREMPGAEARDGLTLQFSVELDSAGQPAAKGCRIVEPGESSSNYGAVAPPSAAERSAPY